MILSTLSVVNGILERHWKEFKSSAISDTLIKLNFRTIEDSREVDKILNRNNKRRWNHSDKLVPAWIVSGIDPLTDEPTLQGVQVKPDTPDVGEDGKIRKYLGAKDYDTAPLFLNTGTPYYWKAIFDDVLIPIIITEGAKKAAAGLSINLATISIPGVSTCRKKGRLHQNLELFAKLGRTFYLCFDNDILHKVAVQKALLSLSKELAAKGSKIMIIPIPEGEAKGMDDYIAIHGEESFKELITNALTFEEWKEEIQNREAEEDTFNSRTAMRFHEINKIWGEHLRYNTLKKDVELYGSSLDMNHIKLIIALEFDIDITKDDGFTIIEKIAKSNAYSPVVEYLNEVGAKHPDITGSFLDNLAFQFFGTDDPLHATYLKNFLVSAVARARQPGCWMDCALILQGKQGIRKSTFWRTLFGDDWFTDDLGNDNDKDEKMKMHRFWCLEWGEFETVYKRKDVEELKRFLAKKEETFRTPYDRQPVDYQRGFVFVGTTNQQEILNDPTGDRRFWIIPVTTTKIPVERVQILRDKIWAAANALYNEGYAYRLSDEEEVKRAEQNQDYQITDPWLEIIEDFLYPGQKFISSQGLYKLLGIEPSKQDKFAAGRISGVMRRLGWEKGREFGVRGNRGWILEENKIENFSKNQNLPGSPGSPGSLIEETLINQGFQHDPIEGQVSLILRDQEMLLWDQVQPSVLNTTIEKTDPIEADDPGDPGMLDQMLDQEEVSHSNTSSNSDPGDPGDPGKFSKNENLKVDDTKCITRPQKCSYYSLYDTKPFIFKVDSDFGAVQISAEPYHKFKGVDSKIWLAFEMPDGQILTKTIKAIPDKKLLPRWSIECGVIKQWEEKVRKTFSSKVNSDCKFKVRITGEDDYEWIEDCILKEVPNPPTTTNFIFTTPKNTIVTSHFGEFEEI